MPAAPRSCAGRPRSRWGRDSRRSWDLLRGLAIVRGVAVAHALAIFRSTSREPRAKLQPGTIAEKRPAVPPRSEEHTSELQSLRHLVCRLLLEKKKNKHQAYAIHQIARPHVNEKYQLTIRQCTRRTTMPRELVRSIWVSSKCRATLTRESQYPS